MCTKRENGQQQQERMNDTQLGWLVALIVVVLVILFCYVYLDRTFRRLILPPRFSSAVRHRTPHVHVDR